MTEQVNGIEQIAVLLASDIFHSSYLTGTSGK